MKRTRRGQILIAIVLVFLAGWLAWQWFDASKQDSATAERNLSTNNVQRQKGQGQVATQSGKEPRAARNSWPTAWGKFDPANPPASIPIEVCQLGTDSVTKETRVFPERFELFADGAWAKLRFELLNSGSDAERFGAHILSIHRQSGAIATSGNDVQLPIESIALDEDFKAAAQLAGKMRDPNAHWAMLSLCGYTAHPACESISRKTLMELDASNAAMWLQMAADSQNPQRNTGITTEEALRRAGNATRFDPIQSPVGALFKSKAFKSMPENERMALSATLTHSLFDSGRVLSTGPLTKYCSAAAVTEPARREWCSKMVARVESEASELYEHYGLFAVRKNLGATPEQIAAHRNRLQALQNFQPIPSFLTMLTCESQREMESWAMDVAERGELGALKFRFKKSGLTEAEAVAAFKARP